MQCALNTGKTDAEIHVSFYCQGVTKRFQGTLSVCAVDLVFKNSKNEVSVNVPDRIDPDVMQRLNFTCCDRLPNGMIFDAKQVDSLKMTVEQIKNLKVVAGLLEESPSRGPMVMDSSGRVTSEKRYLRNNREVHLEQPQEIELGQSYRIVFNSTEQGMSAKLVKESQPEKKVCSNFSEYAAVFKEALEKTTSLNASVQLIMSYFNTLPLDDLEDLKAQGKKCLGRTVVPNDLVFADARKSGKIVTDNPEWTYEYLTLKQLRTFVLMKRKQLVLEFLGQDRVKEAILMASDMHDGNKFSNEGFIAIFNYLMSKNRMDEAFSIVNQNMQEGPEQEELRQRYAPAAAAGTPTQLQPAHNNTDNRNPQSKYDDTCILS